MRMGFFHSVVDAQQLLLAPFSMERPGWVVAELCPDQFACWMKAGVLNKA